MYDKIFLTHRRYITKSITMNVTQQLVTLGPFAFGHKQMRKTISSGGDMEQEAEEM